MKSKKTINIPSLFRNLSFRAICIVLSVSFILCIGFNRIPSTEENSTEVLSRLGSRGDEVRQAQRKL